MELHYKLTHNFLPTAQIIRVIQEQRPDANQPGPPQIIEVIKTGGRP